MITVNSDGNPISAGFISALTSDNRTYDARLLISGTQLDCSITRLTITKGSCGSAEAFAIGNVVGSTLVAEVRGLSTAVKGQEIEVQIGVSVNGSYEYITLGYFVVSEAPQTVYETTITAYGATITRTGDAFTPPSTQTLANIASAISSSVSALAGRTVNVTFDSGITTTGTITVPLNNLTVYDALAVLAGAVGGYAIDTYNGHIKICRFSDTATVTRDTSTMISMPVVEEDDFEIDGVLCVVTPESQDDEGQVIPAVQFPQTPTGNENLVLQNQYMTQALYNSYLYTLAGYEYRPANIELSYGDPRLEGNDVVQVTDVNSNVYIIPCHMITHTYTGGFSTQVVSASATPQSNEVATSAGSLTETLSGISQSAISARTSAETAKAYAEEAKQTTDEINEYAESAQKTVTQILQDGEEAGENAQQAKVMAQSAVTSAGTAYESAVSALTSLGLVEDVIGTLNWVQQHGYYALSQDTTVTANKVYYTITATAVQSPTGNPSMNGYYERSGAGTEADPYIYALSADTTVDSQKTYYTVNATTVANPTGNPNENLYYDLLLDTAMSQYVNTHLALTDAGLSVMNNNSSGSMLLSTEGVTIKNAQGITVGKYGEGATIGALDSQHISIVNGQINFWAGTETIQENLVAYVSGQELHIPRVVVVQSLQMGNWRWDATLEGHLSLNWIG